MEYLYIGDILLLGFFRFDISYFDKIFYYGFFLCKKGFDYIGISRKIARKMDIGNFDFIEIYIKSIKKKMGMIKFFNFDF